MKSSVALVALLFVAVGVAESQAERKEQELRAKIDKAILDLKNLETALSLFQVRTGAYPESLTQLTKPDGKRPAVLQESHLNDPWGRPYRYDPMSLHPKTMKPLIFTHGPDLGEPKGKITNWDIFDKKKK